MLERLLNWLMVAFGHDRHGTPVPISPGLVWTLMAKEMEDTTPL